MNDDDDIASLVNSLPEGSAGIAPKSDDNDISDLMGSLDKPAQGGTSTLDSLRSLPLVQRIARSESGDPAHPQIGNGGGVGQFEPTTWRHLMNKYHPEMMAGKSDADVLAMRGNQNLNTEMIGHNIEENTSALTQLGIPVNDGTLKGAHWFGAKGFSQIYNSDPGTPIENVIGKDVAAQNNISGKTTHDVENLAARAVGLPYMEKELTLEQALGLAAHNALPSAAGAVSGIVHAVTNPGETLGTLKQLGTGLMSKARGYADMPQDPAQKAKDEALLDGLIDSKKEQYSTWEGFLNHMANDPADLAIDASTVAGGGGAALRATGAVAKVAGMETLGNAAGAVGRAIQSPTKALSGLVNPSTKVLDSSGQILPKVDKLIQKVTNGTMSGADIVDPAVKKAFQATVAAKPLSEASVREGLLKSLGLSAPTSVVTGVAGPTGAVGRVAEAVAGNNEKLSTHAEALGGATNGSEIGAALDQAHTASLNRANGAYDSIRNLPGSFGNQMPEMGALGQRIRNSFNNAGIASSSLSALKASGYTQSVKALQMIQRFWNNGRTLTQGGDFDGGEVLAMRKSLNNLASSATGSDAKALGLITKAIDTHVQDLSARGFFVDANGTPVQGLGQRINAANKAYAQHFATFDENPNPAIRSAVNQLTQERARLGNPLVPSGNDALYSSVQKGIQTSLMDPAKGANTYQQLMRATNNSRAVKDTAKTAILDSVGAKTPKNIGQILSNPQNSAAAGLSPSELATVRHLHAASAINNAKPRPGSTLHRIFSSAMGSVVGKSLGAVAGNEALGPIGIPLGIAAESGAEGVMHGIQNARAMKGAPKAPWPRRVAARALSPTAIAAGHYSQDPSVKPIQRASGGKVDIDVLVNRLIKRWKDAKKATDETTKPLLKTPDSTIARALAVAQEHL